MFTDIAGYTALMGRNEKRAMELVSINRKVHQQHLDNFDGRLLKEMGDGILASFHSVSAAVKCAIAIIQSTKSEEDLNISVGIHLGEVNFSENDVYGDGVNIASRIEAMARPNSIMFSEKVWDELQNQSDIEAKLMGTFQLKNDRRPRDIYAVEKEGIYLPDPKEFQGGKVKELKQRATKRKRISMYAAIVMGFILILAYFLMQNNKYKQEKVWAETIALPAIQKYLDEYVFPGQSNEGWKTLDLATKAREILPENPTIDQYFTSRTREVYFTTEPAGSQVFMRPYDGDTNWRYLGISPLHIVAPNGISQVKIELTGYRPFYDLLFQSVIFDDSLYFELNSQSPEGMVFIPQTATTYIAEAAASSLRLVGLEASPYIEITDFFMDKYEVTNKHYQAFVNAGGYSNPEYWDFSFQDENRSFNFQEAMAMFIDKTGRPGPASWEVGTYPEGTDDLPVTGISWFEAAAYATFVGKSLPSVYHWDRAALTWGSNEIILTANLNAKGLKPVGNSINRFGVYDLAGNAREWCTNPARDEQRFILGGGWNDFVYGFNDAYAQSPFDRSITNGFRCIKQLNKREDDPIFSLRLDVPDRDFYSEPKISDDTYSTYLAQFQYDKTELESVIDSVSESDEWIRQWVEFNAAYGNERMAAFVFIPKKGTPPYQTVVYYPGSGAIHTNSSKDMKPHAYIINSGRAIVYPILKSTYERRDELISDYPDESVFWKEHIIMWVKDFMRTIDYLETRKDIDVDKIAYYGSSWGGAMGAIVPAVEKRFKISMLLVAGLLQQRSLPEVEQYHYLPRNTIPTLMLNGKYDFFFPYESSQKPFFELLGTPEKDKKLLLYEGSHSVPRLELIKEVLGWMDQYFGKQEMKDTM